MKLPSKPAPRAVVGWIAFVAAVSVLTVSAPANSAPGSDTSSAITIDDLVRRAAIPLAAISPDGRYAAYVLLQGDPVADAYDFTVRLADLNSGAAPITLTSYRLAPEDAKDETDNIQAHAAALYWSASQTLFYLERTHGKARLKAWHSRDGKSRTVLEGHDRIAIEPQSVATTLTISTGDFIARPAAPPDKIADNVLVMRDGLRHYDLLKNPKVGRWLRQQEWTVALLSTDSIVASGPATDSPETTLEDWAMAPAEMQVEDSADSSRYVYDLIPSPDGALTAAVEESSFNLSKPGESYSGSRVVVMEGTQRRGLMPFESPNPRLWILGWDPGRRSFLYVNNNQRGTTLNRVTVAGKVRTLYREYANLAKGCGFLAKSCQSISGDGRYALLLRSNNTLPVELVRIDMRSGIAVVVDSPNQKFVAARHPVIREYPIEAKGAKTMGRLYLPLDYHPGNRYPLVITQYVSTPGYYAATGDEAPIQPLTANGIAVYAMEARPFNDISNMGDFRMELSRVQRPLEGMEWLCRKLNAEGLIDTERLGIIGLSYGAEITMYAYWRSRLFRAVAAATASWDPSLTSLAGVQYGKLLDTRGMPVDFDDGAVQKWKQLSAGLNASLILPPLLIQGPDGEQYFTAPTWLRLRRANAPVEWLQYPNEGHEKRSPANRWWVYSRNLDWFRFWLKDEVDNEPAKVEQYQRWRALRETHAASLERRGCSTENSALNRGDGKPSPYPFHAADKAQLPRRARETARG